MYIRSVITYGHSEKGYEIQRREFLKNNCVQLISQKGTNWYKRPRNKTRQRCTNPQRVCRPARSHMAAQGWEALQKAAGTARNKDPLTQHERGIKYFPLDWKKR